jgi:hypothetical protein
MRLDLFGGAQAELLFATFPLIRLLRGEKRAAMRRAWIRSATGLGAQVLKVDEGRLPRDVRACTRELFRSVLEIAEAQGLSGIDLTELFNGRREAGEIGQPQDFDEAVLRAFALLSLLGANRIAANHAELEEGKLSA